MRKYIWESFQNLADCAPSKENSYSESTECDLESRPIRLRIAASFTMIFVAHRNQEDPRDKVDHNRHAAIDYVGHNTRGFN